MCSQCLTEFQADHFVFLLAGFQIASWHSRGICTVHTHSVVLRSYSGFMNIGTSSRGGAAAVAVRRWAARLTLLT